jgi:hypothetical protein
MNLKEMGWEDVDCIHFALDEGSAVQCCFEHGKEPFSFTNSREFLE